ncbi:hypothetical protein NST50_29640 [Paenibacillus sp. FSL E2-0202]|uniref:hypothetical protein n=1 Tax=Paenibacillus sp. FSL E2-0202 TaxID=2954505 RepID=UPI0030EC0B99
MFILGKSNYDKGKQLEELTKKILIQLDYQNITTNYIGPGGEEIDVVADFKIPSIGMNITRRLICECKAYKTPLDTSSWLKFLGKVFVEESSKEEVYGCFIALSGVNGNVKGNYEEIRKNRSNIILVTGETLNEAVTQMYNLGNLNDINGKIKRLTNKMIRMTEICYYDNDVYWIVVFNNDEYTLLNSLGDFLIEETALIISSLIESSNAYGKYVDILKENQAALRFLYNKKAVLSGIMINNGCMEIEELIKFYFGISDISSEEILHSINELLLLGFIECKGSNVCITNSFNDLIIDFFRFFLSEDFIFIQAVGCEFYDSCINDDLINRLEEIQYGMRFSSEERSAIMKLIKLSPSAFSMSLYPEETISGYYRQGLNDSRIEEHNRKYFMKLLYDSFMRDFGNEYYIDYFYEVRGIIEIQSDQMFKIKGEQGLITEGDFANRITIMKVPDEHGGGHVQALVMSDHPEPWEGLGILTKKAESSDLNGTN